MSNWLKFLIYMAVIQILLVTPQAARANATTKTGPQELNGSPNKKAQATALKKKAVRAYENMENAPYLIDLLSDYIALAPDDFEGYLMRGEVELEYGNCELEASADLKKALQLNPRSWKASVLAITNGFIPNIQDNKSGALETLKPDKAKTIEELVLISQAELAEKMKWDTKHQYRSVHGSPGLVGAPIMEPQKTIVSLSDLPRPKTPRDYFRLANMMCSSPCAVVSYCNLALKINPNATTVILLKAKLDDDPVETLAGFDKAVFLDPACDAYEGRAEAKYQKGDIEGAIVDLKTDSKIHSQAWLSKPVHFLRLLHFQRKAKKWQDAVTTCSRMIALTREPYALELRANLYCEKYRFSDALQDIDTALSLNFSDGLLARRSELRFLCGQPIGWWSDFCNSRHF